MQPIVRAFVEDALELLQPPDPVVEFGSRQVEDDQARDADLRSLFAGRDYTGTDLIDGPGVDRVEDIRALSLADDSVGTAICLETLEHCADPFAAGRELARVVRPGGVAIVTTPFLIGIHGYPDDYFRFTPAAMHELLSGFEAVWSAGIGDPGSPLWVLTLAAHCPQLDAGLERLPRVRAAQQRWESARGVVRVGPLQIAPGVLARTFASELARLARQRIGGA